MKTQNSYNKLLVYLIPVITLAWGLYYYFTSEPFFVKSSDPEYPYLINGLNCALLRFDHIGHTDHPGTPFQIFIGLIIQITHLLFGKGNIALDVLRRPEFYLGAVSVSLTIIQAVLVLIIGKIGIRKYQLTNIIILQLSPFYNQILLNLNGRCNPDRFFIVVTLLFIIVLLKFAFTENAGSIKLAIGSGIVMGLGVATKINYIPVLILPLFLLTTWNKRGIYMGSVLISFIVFISPILKKFSEFRGFISGIIKHDGLYGAGNPQIFNLQKIAGNIKTIFTLNPELIFVLISILFLLVVLTIRKTEKTKQYKLFLIGYLILYFIQLLMVAKHFKNYYLTPLFTTYGLFIFMVILLLQKMNFSNKISTIIKFILPAIFLLISLYQTFTGINDKNGIARSNLREKVALFVDKNIDKNDYWFVEPTWESGPYVENALVYGLSYCAHRNDYENTLNQINPHIITYEGKNRLPQRWRSSVISLDTILLSNKKLHILSTPGRHANDLIDQIIATATPVGIKLKIDTLFNQSESNTQIIQVATDFGHSTIDREKINKHQEQGTNGFDQK